MKRVLFSSAAALLGATLLAGCGGGAPFVGGDDRPTRPVDSNLISQSYEAAEALLGQAEYLRDTQQPLLMATFVDINALETSSSLGRMIAEQVASRFVQLGFAVKEMKLRESIFIVQNGGEFALSRSILDISQSHDAAAVIAGTYAIGRNSVFINARLVRAIDGRVLAAYDYTLPLGPDTRALVASQ
ncbi:MAG: FlgO family outer membrane protein [Candidatus Competibacterales bacterium]